MRAPRRLIVNADDLGLSDGVNAGILRAHREGIVTSASLMVRGAAAPAAAALARDAPQLSLGLHLDLAEWRYRDGDWHAAYRVIDTDDAEAVAAETARQLEAFQSLVGRDPTHLDSHQHVHRDEPVRSVALAVGRRLGIPVRHHGWARYCGAFYGHGRHGVPMPESIGVDALVGIVRELPDGVTELCCHPAAAVEAGSDYAAERPLELAALCDRRVHEAIVAAGVTLCSFASPARNSSRR
jgi:predicted glycoside hydrolase/deacetylase ChbG (UPF0249 family)